MFILANVELQVNRWLLGKLYFFPQVPELFGPIRTIAEGRGESVLIGTTKNFVLQGSLDGEFIPITQVDAEIYTHVL